MTAIINLRSGGKTEARIGDTVKVNPSGEVFIVREIQGACLRDQHMFIHAADECTLISRPFQVGDSVEVQMPYDSYIATVKEVWSNRLTTIDDVTHFQSDCRHTNPDWRGE